jgi:hypothetical protein
MKTRFAGSIFCVVSIVFAGLAQTNSGDEAIWKDFLNWLAAQPPNSRPYDLIGPYRDKMLREGVPTAEADRRMELVGGLAFTRPEGVKLLWNKIYAGKGPIFCKLRQPSS